MPRLPTEENLGQRRAPQPSTDVSVADTSATGRAMSQFGRVTQVVAERIEKKNDEQAVFEARRKLDEWERKTIYDPETGVVAQRGEKALDLPNKIPAEFDKFSSEVASTLQTNRQRKIFEEMSLNRKNQVTDFTLRHSLTQKEVYEEGQVEADMAASGNRAVLLATNGQAGPAKAEIDIANGRLTSFMKQRGASGEEIAQAVLENSSKTHTGVIQSLVNTGRPTEAQAYLEANGGAMTEVDKTRVGGSLKEGVLRKKAQDFTDGVMKEGLDMGAALEKARTTLSGDEEQAATQEIKVRFAEKEAAKAHLQKENSDEAWKIITNGGTRNQIPPVMWNNLSGQQQREINDYTEAKWRRAKADAEGKDTDPQRFYELRLQAANDPIAFSKLDLMKEQPKLSKAHFDQLIGIQAGVNKNAIKESETQGMVKKTIEMVKAEAQSIGIDFSPKEGTKKAKDLATFNGSLANALDQAVAAKGAPLTPAEAKAIGMGMLREQVEQGSGFFGIGQSKKREFELTAEDRSKYVVPYAQIPKVHRDAIEKSLGVQRGLYGGVDEALVERTYANALSDGAVK